MKPSEDDKCYVVMQNCVATRVGKREHYQNLRLGTLVYVHHAISAEVVAVRIDSSERLSNSFEEHFWECPILNIIPFDDSMKPYILAISSPKERVELVCNEELCQLLIGIDVGSLVNLIPKKSSSSMKSLVVRKVKRALVKYKGPVLQMGLGIYFGIELLDPDPTDSDTCDGSCSGSSYYFSCPPGSGKFVAINRLQPITDTNSHSRLLIRKDLSLSHVQLDKGEPNPFRTCAVQEVRAKFEKMSHNSPHSSQMELTAKLIDLSPSRSPISMEDQPLKVGERVVYFGDSGQEHGVVKWLGHLDGTKALNAGVEFEHPVGKCNGIYKGKQLFNTKKNHGLFMPVSMLIKADDLYEDVFKKKRNALSSPPDSPSCAFDVQSTPFSSSSSSTGGGTLKPDQLYSSSKLKQLDFIRNNSSIDAPDSSLCINGSALSPIEKEQRNVQNNVVDKRKDNLLKDVDMTSYGFNNPCFLNSKSFQDRPNSKSNDSVKVSSAELVDINLGKLKNVTRNSKANNIYESETDVCWTGNKWNNSNKQDFEVNLTSGSMGKSGTNNFDRSPNFCLNKTNDLDADVSQCQSPGEHCYYDSPEASQNHQGVYDSHDVSNAQPDLGIGSVVEVVVHGEPLYGVIRWIGSLPDDKKSRKVAGVEMEEERTGFSDGTFHGHRYFECNPRRALFVNINMCQKDGRFQEPPPSASIDTKFKTFGQVDCPVIPGVVRPVAVSGDLQNKCGKFHGIQGHHNSCYLDATLFSMFTFTSVFDSLLYRPPTEKDCVQYEEVQRVLREEIVNPLRANLFVRADRVMKLRTLLENHSSVSGLTSEEKDPEEFLNSLIAQILRAEPFLKLSSGQEAYHYQLFVEKDEQLKLPSVQKLFEQSFLASDIKLKEVPSCLIIQMPRFGKSFKMYPRILPSQLLDVTDVIEDSPRQCTVCGKLAEFECKECMDHYDIGLENIAYCEPCLRTAHSHQRRINHVWRHLRVPLDFKSLQEACSTIPRLYMELFAVVCIETSHYVAFVKCGSGSDAPWCFFDSMADRKGEQNGYNIPEMVPCPDLPYWLSDKGAQSLMDVHDNRQLPEHAKRLFCDAYMCMYQSSDVMMYR